MRTDIEAAEREWRSIAEEMAIRGFCDDLAPWAYENVPSLLADVRELVAANERLRKREKNWCEAVLRLPPEQRAVVLSHVSEARLVETPWGYVESGNDLMQALNAASGGKGKGGE